MVSETTHFYQNDPKEKGGAVTKPAVSEKKESADEKYIRCNKCLRPITRPSDRMSVNGSHSHSFANPSGLLYEIGCFRSVMGCGYMGPASDEFTWFKGYSWKVAYCARCFTHLGWRFTASDLSFNGLILERITDPQ